MDPNCAREMKIKAALALMGSTAKPSVFAWMWPDDTSLIDGGNARSPIGRQTKLPNPAPDGILSSRGG